MPYTLSLFADTLAPDAKPALLPAANRVLYVTKGAAEVDANGSVARLTKDGSGFSPGTLAIGAGADGAEVLRWELTRDPASNGSLPGATIRKLLAAPVTIDAGAQYLIRLDTIELGVGGKAPKHVHQGPGIRCLLEGGFTVETQGHTNSYKPGEAWFETGPDPVVAWAPADKNAKFVRVMILPRALMGKMSTRYLETNPTAATQGRRWFIYFDRAIEP